MNIKSLKHRVTLLTTLISGLLLLSGCNTIIGWSEKLLTGNKEKPVLESSGDNSLDARLADINARFWAAKSGDVDESKKIIVDALTAHDESKKAVQGEASEAVDKAQGMTEAEKNALYKKAMQKPESVQLSEKGKEIFVAGKSKFSEGWNALWAQSKEMSQILAEEEQAIDNALGLRKPQPPSYSSYKTKEQYKQAYKEYEEAYKVYRDKRLKGLMENQTAKNIQRKYAPAHTLNFAIMRESISMAPTKLRMYKFGTAHKIDVSDLDKLISVNEKEVQKLNKASGSGDTET